MVGALGLFLGCFWAVSGLLVCVGGRGGLSVFFCSICKKKESIMELYDDDEFSSDGSRDDMSVDLSSDDGDLSGDEDDDGDEEDDSFIVNDGSSLEEDEAEYDDDDDGIDTRNILSTRLRSAPAQTVRFWDEHVDQSILWADADAKDVFEPLRSDDDILSDDVFSDDDDESE